MTDPPRMLSYRDPSASRRRLRLWSLWSAAPVIALAFIFGHMVTEGFLQKLLVLHFPVVYAAPRNGHDVDKMRDAVFDNMLIEGMLSVACAGVILLEFVTIHLLRRTRPNGHVGLWAVLCGAAFSAIRWGTWLGARAIGVAYTSQIETTVNLTLVTLMTVCLAITFQCPMRELELHQQRNRSNRGTV